MITRALEGLKHLWLHEPLRLLYVGSLALGLAYEQLNGGATLETAALALAVFLVEELGRSIVTSPATADPEHVH